MATGGYTAVDVSKEDYGAKNIVMEGSTLLSIVESAGIPMTQLDVTTYHEDVRVGGQGSLDVDLDAPIDATKSVTKRCTADVQWAKFKFEWTDSAKIYTSQLSKYKDADLRDASADFAAMKDYMFLTKAVSVVKSTVTCSNKWTSGDATILQDILDARNYIMTESKWIPTDIINLIVPVGVSSYLDELLLIGGATRTLRDYITQAYKIRIFEYRPAMAAEATTFVRDGLSDDAVMFLSGAATGGLGLYSEKAFAAAQVPSIEKYRINERSDVTTLKMGVCALPIWDGHATWTTATNFKTARIVKIATVK